MLMFRARALWGALTDGLWLHPATGLASGLALAFLAPALGGVLPVRGGEFLQPRVALLQSGLQALAGIAFTLLALTLSVLMVVLQSVASQ